MIHADSHTARRDLAATLRPCGFLAVVPNHGADRLLHAQQSARDRAPDLTRDSRDGVQDGFSSICDAPAVGSDDPAIGAQRLAVDPAGIGAGEEGDGSGDVIGLAQPFQRSEPPESTLIVPPEMFVPELARPLATPLS